MAQLISLRIPDELIDKIERRMKVRHQKRTEVILEALHEIFNHGAQSESEQPKKSLDIPDVVRGAGGELKPAASKTVETEQELCGYRTYNDIDGEWYRCGRAKNHGIKHSDWIKD